MQKVKSIKSILKSTASFIKNIGKFKIKDHDGNVIQHVSVPTAIYNQNCGTLVRIGEREAIRDYYAQYTQLLKQDDNPELVQLAENLQLVEIPPLQKAVDKVVQEKGYVKTLHQMIQVAEMNNPPYLVYRPRKQLANSK